MKPLAKLAAFSALALAPTTVPLSVAAGDRAADCSDAWGVYNAVFDGSGGAVLYARDAGTEWPARVVARQTLSESSEYCTTAEGAQYGGGSMTEAVKLVLTDKSAAAEIAPDGVILICAEEVGFWPFDGSEPVCKSTSKSAGGILPQQKAQ